MAGRVCAKHAYNRAHLEVAGLDGGMLHGITLGQEKLVARAFGARSLPTVVEGIVVCSPDVVSGALVPADVVAQCSDCADCMNVLKLAYFVEESRADVAMDLPFARFSGTNGLC